MPKPGTDSCAVCQYYRTDSVGLVRTVAPNETVPKVVGTVSMICARNPPVMQVVIIADRSTFQSMYPNVMATDWCGEYKKA